MLESIFKAVLVMSAAGTVFSAIIALCRPMTLKLFGHRWQYYIWFAVVLVMLIPVSVSVDSHGKAVPHSATTVQNYEEITVAPSAVYTNISDVTVSELPSNTASAQKNHTDSPWISAGAYIWAACAVLIFAAKILQYLIFLRTIRKNSVRTADYKKARVRSSTMSSAPFTVGLFKKTILIPGNVSDSVDKNHILLHEYTHIKNGDLYFKWLCLIVRCVHWFNPFVYIISNMIDRQCEIVCDITVTKNMNDSEKKSYMNTILSMISSFSNGPSELTTSMASSKSNITSRFSAIVSNRKKKKTAVALSALCAVIALLTAGTVSAVLGGRIYDEKLPHISFNVPSVNSQSDGNYARTSQKAAAFDSPDSLQKQKKDKSLQKSTGNPEVMKPPMNTELHEAPSEPIPDNNRAYSLIPNGKAPEADGHSAIKGAESPLDLATEEASSSSDSNGKVSKESNREAISEIYDVSYDAYPYSGRIRYDGLTMAAITADIEQNGGTALPSEGGNLNNGYIPGTLTYEKGGVSQHKNVTSDDRGHITFYMNSDYEQYVDISFVSDGEQIAGYGIIPDNETTYVFGGFDPGKEYDITITSSTGSTWMVESDYLIY